MECLNTNSPPVGVHDFASFGVKSGQKLQRSASNPTFRRPAFPLAEVACLDGEASALYWDERDCSSAIAVWRHAMSYLDVYAYESNHCGVMLDDGEFPDYAELRFNIGLQVATAVFVEMDASGGFDTNERDCKKKHNDRCNLAIAHLARAGSMLCTELFDAGAEARLCFLYAKMSSMIWPANVREAAAAIEQACALDPGVPSYEKEHDDIYVISYATETGNLDAVHEQEEDQASPQWTIIDRPNHAVPGPGYTAYRYLPKDIGASLRAELANSEGDEIS